MSSDPSRDERFDALFREHVDAVRAYGMRRDPSTGSSGSSP